MTKDLLNKIVKYVYPTAYPLYAVTVTIQRKGLAVALKKMRNNIEKP